MIIADYLHVLYVHLWMSGNQYAAIYRPFILESPLPLLDAITHEGTQGDAQSLT